MKRTRILWKDDTVLKDISEDVRRFNADSRVIPFDSANDYLFVGNVAPFNHFFVELLVPNTIDTAMTIEYWDGSEWRAVVETLDFTDGFKESHWIEFVPDEDHGWVWESTDNDPNMGLSAKTIYGLYWIRISFSVSFSAGTEIKYIGQKFSDDNDLTVEYKDLLKPTVMDRFETGKTNWDEQHFRAAEYIQKELTKKNIIFNKGQILSRDQFAMASIHKVAEMAFNNFGPDWIDRRKTALNDYTKALDLRQFPVDKNLDGRLNRGEQTIKAGVLRRE
jgi:hypothetical protein